MPKSLSLYLDLVRFLAAVAVLIAHLSSSPLTEGIDWRGTSMYGEIAVTLFFVLSGYVISFVTTQREKQPIQFVAARLSRIYSVVIVALALTLTLDYAGQHLNESFYAIKKVLWEPPSVVGYLASLLLLNEFQVFGFEGISPGTNGPYWSLSFEATYYAIAGLLLFTRPRVWIPLTAVILLLGGRTIIALLPLWMLGFVLFRFPRRFIPKLHQSAWLVIFILSAVVIAALPHYSWRLPSDNFGHYFPVGRGASNRNLIVDYVAAALFALNLVSALMLSDLAGKILVAPRVIRWLGSLTFPLYLLHYPVLCFLGAISPWPTTTISNALFLACGAVLVTIVLTPVCDKLRDRIRLWITERFGHTGLVQA